ncbi:cell wall hydrolase/autolysin [Chthoniobacter flavus Ellin428]|uniref:N-acetylmuramoyl-L-alanine amidase n=1 Tax=Chthoniobacter flavus Ellin428 TaxID=497964 RepID=B4CY29_9BACT|nr:N-acetylmuramoyl-L-alanine amidase [Chthoniobacter flavus]EDY21177.1 cell wall hydrolase/autolysin [Chthoniobacter flavus Ellin428]
MKTSPWVPAFCCTILAVLAMHATAAEWNLVRFESREYVTLDNIAQFYGFPKPPPVDLTGHFTAAANAAPALAPTVASLNVAAKPATIQVAPVAPVSIAASEKSSDEPAPISSKEPPPATPLSKTITLDSGKSQLEVTVGLREASINGVKHWLAFPVAFHDGQVLVSRLDLSKIIEPNLRPELIPGMTPVTTVVLDPGHGGHDNGAVSKYGYEKNFALDVALRARKLLEAEGYKVVMTRATDVFIPLEQRPAVANHIPNSIFVSIHFNSSSTNLTPGDLRFSPSPPGARPRRMT